MTATTLNSVSGIMVLTMLTLTLLGCLIARNNTFRVLLLAAGTLLGTLAVVAVRDVLREQETPEPLTTPPPQVTPAVGVKRVPPTKVGRDEILVLIDGDLLEVGAEMQRRDKKEAAAAKAYLQKHNRRG